MMVQGSGSGLDLALRTWGGWLRRLWRLRMVPAYPVLGPRV